MAFWIGVVLNVFGSVQINFGTNLMKLSHDRTSRRVDQGLEPGKKDKDLWIVGMSIFVLGSLINFSSFAFAAQSLLAALGTVQFVSNVVFASTILGEELTRPVLGATATIVCGNVLAVVYSNHESRSYTASDLIGLYDTGYFVFLTLLAMWLAMLHVVYTIYDRAAKRGSPLAGSYFMLPATYAMFSAIIGTQSVLQSKCLSELLEESFAGNNQFTSWFTYVIIGVLIVGLTIWLKRMNRALAMFDGLLIIPLLQVNWTLFAILQGGIYFHEFQTFSNEQWGGFTGGVGLVFFGVFLLSRNDASKRSTPPPSAHGSNTKLADQDDTGHSPDGSDFADSKPPPPGGKAAAGAGAPQRRRSARGSLTPEGGDHGLHVVSLTFVPVVVYDQVDPEMEEEILQHRRSSEGGITMHDLGSGGSGASIRRSSAPAAELAARPSAGDFV